MTIDPTTADNLTWFLHSKSRLNYWQSMQRDDLSSDMAAQWGREMLKAYANMTKDERTKLRMMD